MSSGRAARRCLRIHPVRDGLPGPESWLILRKEENGKKKYQFSNASPNTKMNRFAEMSCSRYWIERALEDAKIGKNCVIGKSVYIDEGVEIGDKSKGSEFCFCL